MLAAELLLTKADTIPSPLQFEGEHNHLSIVFRQIQIEKQTNNQQNPGIKTRRFSSISVASNFTLARYMLSLELMKTVAHISIIGSTTAPPSIPE